MIRLACVLLFDITPQENTGKPPAYKRILRTYRRIFRPLSIGCGPCYRSVSSIRSIFLFGLALRNFWKTSRDILLCLKYLLWEGNHRSCFINLAVQIATTA